MRLNLSLIILFDLRVVFFGGQSGYCPGSKFPTLSCSICVQASFVSGKPQNPYKNL